MGPSPMVLPRLLASPRKSRCLQLRTRLHPLNVSFSIEFSCSFHLADSILSRSATIAAEASDKQTTSDDVTQDKPANSHEDIEMADTPKPDDIAPTADGSAEPTADTPASAGKSKARRKSGGIPEHKGKKLNKKASKAKMNHSDAKPGDYFYVRLKGYPLWPAIVCDESMLPNTLIKSRPVTAARPDGSYRADFEDGGPKVKDRSFPVMYLHTNEL
jgi:PWWP domain